MSGFFFIERAEIEAPERSRVLSLSIQSSISNSCQGETFSIIKEPT